MSDATISIRLVEFLEIISRVLVSLTNLMQSRQSDSLNTVCHVGCNVTIFRMKARPHVLNIMAESASTLSTPEFLHCNLVDVPSLTNPFIEKMAGENLPVKVTLTSGYKFSQESYLHDVEGKPPTVSALSVIGQ